MQDSFLSKLPAVGVVAIGRNEGDRFRACLASLPQGIPAVYVDSGSTDNSVAFAKEAGVHIVHLSTDQGFTAARARNAGWRALLDRHPNLRFIQFLDGDCTLDPEWLPNALVGIEKVDKIAVVFGRLKERFPEKSIYNAICDREWNVAVGKVRACGGNALIRVDALVQVQGYNNELIAGEEPDLCLRMRACGWSIHRIAGEMGMHDAAILDFDSWWTRAKRAGHAYAEHIYLHKQHSDPDWLKSIMSMILWSIVLPSSFFIGLGFAIIYNRLAILFPILIGFLFIVQFGRLWVSGKATGLSNMNAGIDATLIILSKFAQIKGAGKFLVGRLRGRRSKLIEYK